eukprot:c3928_g1_i2.p1 GENE.c3928_g1_i2~~c3928_g1_i2.p1  ORF type:complete len:107 (+),score=16.14 c3928_g1_i2:28-321(+)
MFDFIQEGQVDELAKYIEEHKSSANVFDVNQQDTRPGWLMFSGIHHAAFKGHANVCQFLIANGANVNIKDKVISDHSTTSYFYSSHIFSAKFLILCR